MDVSNKLYAPIRWLLTKENKGKKMENIIDDSVEQAIRRNSPAVGSTSDAQQLSGNDDISRFATNLKNILIASDYDVDIIFDDAVSIARKI